MLTDVVLRVWCINFAVMEVYPLKRFIGHFAYLVFLLSEYH
jgi:hypothetical protein